MACLDEVAAAAADGLNDLLALARRLQVLSRLRHMLAPLAHRRASSSVGSLLQPVADVEGDVARLRCNGRRCSSGDGWVV